MILSPALRKLTLTVHIAFSVGWIGAVAGYLALDVAATAAQDGETVRAAFIGMGLITRSVLVPLAIGTLLTGLIVSVVTKWGLFRYYWVLISLVLTLIAMVVLLVETKTIAHHAGLAASPATSADALIVMGGTLLHSIGGLVVLLVILALNVYKPQGMTRYGWRKRNERPKMPVL